MKKIPKEVNTLCRHCSFFFRGVDALFVTKDVVPVCNLLSGFVLRSI